MKSHLLSRALLATLTYLAAHAATAAEADLDIGFGASGRRAIAFDFGGDKADVPSDITVLADGRIAVAGSARATAPDLDTGAVALLTRDGALDGTFGVQGQLRLDQGKHARLNSIAVRTSDSRLVAGGIGAFGLVQTDYRGVLIWFDTTGSAINVADQFAAGGGSRVNDARFGPEGALYSASSPIGAAGNRDWRLYRYKGSETAYDGTWPNSATTTNLDEPGMPGDDEASRIVIRANGDVIIAGTQRDTGPDAEFAVKRYTATGVDNGFGTAGIVTFGIDLPGSSLMDHVTGLAVDAQNRVVVSGNAERTASGTDTDIVVVRLLPNGQPDPSFGAGGFVVRSFDDAFPEALDVAADLLIDAQGRIVVIGTRYTANSVNLADTALLRLLPNGTPDESFAPNGSARLELNPDRTGRHDRGVAIAMQGGKLVVLAERQFTGPDTDFVVARLQGAVLFADGFE